MRQLARIVPVLIAIAAAAPAHASAATLGRCADDSERRCGTVEVPLDRTGKVPGTVGLHVERATAEGKRTPGAKGVIFALAGGPGQPATQFTTDFAYAFSDTGVDRDIVTFDQRGTGRSGLLRCPEVERVVLLSRYPDAGQRCAERLGARRGLYTTSDSVDDMEAVRQAIGVDRIAIYGASYGTKVAMAYAARYPEHTERLILDSVVTPEGPDPLYLDTLAATRRVLRASCAGDCSWSPDAGEDLTELGRRLGEGPQRGFVVDRRGRRRPQALGSTRLFFLMIGADFDPRTRAALPSAVYNARRGDPAQLLRLAALSESGGEPASPREFSAAVFAATICEEVAFPWSRGSAFEDRPRQTAEYIAGLGPEQFAPFGSGSATETDLLKLCSRWNEAAPPPQSPSPPLPDVPTLILEGELDLRTPLEGAQRVAAALPQSTLITIPATGHSTLGSDNSSCTISSITRFLAGRKVRPTCADPIAPIPPDLPAPLSLDEVEPVTRKLPEPVARVLGGVQRTLDDVEDQAATQALLSFSAGTPGAVRGGGLRGGHFRAGSTGISIDSAEFVPGLKVSGRLLNRAGRIGSVRVSGSRATAGRINFGGRGVVSGRIGGRSFRIRLAQDDSTPPTIELGKLAQPVRPQPKVP